jgi:hypothetical protein
MAIPPPKPTAHHLLAFGFYAIAPILHSRNKQGLGVVPAL